jgi:hypothetical protein
MQLEKYTLKKIRIQSITRQKETLICQLLKNILFTKYNINVEILTNKEFHRCLYSYIALSITT